MPARPVLFAAAAALLLAGFAPRPARPVKRPNIVIIMADDMGFSDLGCYGGEIRTPHLDRLGRQGLRFTQFYNAARCCPSRAALLTGQYPHRAGIGEMVEKGRYAGYLLPTALTAAEALGQAGYQTYMAGKWHVGEDSLHWPLQRGFHHYYGLVSGASSYYELDSGRTFLHDNRRTRPGPGFYATQDYTDHALDFIRQGSASGRPFFLYLAYTAPHWPLHAPDSAVEPYLGRYALGWDALRRQRYRRLVQEGILSPQWPLSPRDTAVPDWATEPRKAHWDRRMAVYAAMVTLMDAGIGRVVEQLERLGELENTVIFFLADNGGCAEIPHIYYKKRKTMSEEALSGHVGNPSSYVGYENRWASASNTPFRLYKSFVHEGGIASPLLVSWPRQIRKGRLVQEVAHITDLMPTCLELAGVPYPQAYAGRPLLPPDGRSLLPLLEGRASLPPRELLWEHYGNRALRQGRWKLVAERNQPWELYDLQADRTETRNLAAAQPGRVATLAKRYHQLAARAGVLP